MTQEGETYYKMRVRVGAGNWIDGADLLIKINGDIVSYYLGEELYSETKCDDDECINYQFYDILIDEDFLRDLAYSKIIIMRVKGARQIDDVFKRILGNHVVERLTWVVRQVHRVEPDDIGPLGVVLL